MLKPKMTLSRKLISLDGLWLFKLDKDHIGMDQHWFEDIESSISIAVPSSYNDLFTEAWIRDFVGDAWYQKDFYNQLQDSRIVLHFGSVTQRADVWLNGVHLGHHEGGFLPFEYDVSKIILQGKNRMVVKVNNELSYHHFPIGKTIIDEHQDKYHYPQFDFFNYAGIHRSVALYTTETSYIRDIEIIPSYENHDGYIDYHIEVTDKKLPVEINVFDQNQLIAKSSSHQGRIHIPSVKLWHPNHPFLYDIHVHYGSDHYEQKTGIRSIEVKNNQILLNNQPIYFKGFGKHDDFEIIGKGLNLPVMIRDFELLKWIGANSIRTTHYPYPEEFYELADQYGIMIIDEVPAVGMWKRSMDLQVTGQKPFFQEEGIMTLTLDEHKNQLKDLIARDKNHPSVVIWSVANEPASDEIESEAYFKEIFDFARTLDPQKRPIGFVNCGIAPANLCKVSKFSDILMLNRYYGWYHQYGQQFKLAKEGLKKELNSWVKTYNKPIIMTEYGADTLSGLHQLPSVMFSEEYQVEFLDMYHEIFDQFDSVIGEHPWNFADFNTEQELKRVGGNKKGIFTRNRQPKMAAHVLRKRWLNIK